MGVDISIKKGVNSIVILGAWCLWKHRNHVVFDGAAPSLSNLLRSSGEEMQFWSLAGARGLSLLLTPDSVLG